MPRNWADVFQVAENGGCSVQQAPKVDLNPFFFCPGLVAKMIFILADQKRAFERGADLTVRL